MSQREILFRAKSLRARQWITGSLISFPGGEIGIVSEDCIEPNDNGNGWDFEYIPCNPSTLCQFTGLRDKNGERIWEGDRIRSEYRDITATVKIGPAKYMGCGVTLYGVYIERNDGITEPFPFSNGRLDWTRLGSIHDGEV